MNDIWFNGWEPLIRILLVGTVSYFTLIILLRATGKRSLSRMNAYDFIITMAMGSILGKIILTKEISLSESITASALLIGLQLLMSWSCIHFRFVHRLISSPPSILFHDGMLNTRAIRRERISKHDIEEAVHAKGLADLSQVDTVIFSSNGQLHVLLKTASLL